MEESRMLINGEWRSSDITFRVANPFDNRAVGEVCQASSHDIDDAIFAAGAAFRRTKGLAAHDRASVLAHVARQVESRREEFARLITLETGKPISYARAEVERCIFTFTIASEEAKRIEGVVLPLDLAPQSSGRSAIVSRFPIGVIGAITPFNFPLNLVAHKLGPAIAAGNTVVLKPSSKAPGTALLLGRIFEETSLPKGAINVTPCVGDSAGQLITNERIKLISFTGSPAVGWAIKSRAGKKKVVLELGGNAGAIVGSDANVEYALGRLIQGAFGNAGQSCISVQRIFVHDSILEEFTSRFVGLAAALHAGDPWDESTVVGPMIDEAEARKAEEWIEEARTAGAQILCGGKRKGAMMEPTVISGANPGLRVCCQEVFAPVVVIDPFSDFRDAVARVNASAYGLQAGLFTNNAADIFYAHRELEVGGIIVNDASSYRMDHMPYGGVKDSGMGREGVRYAIEEMTEMRLLALNFP